MNDYAQTTGSTIAPGIRGDIPPTEFLPLASRIDQLRASIAAALDKTANMTRYPHEEVPQPEGAAKELRDASLISEIDHAADDMRQLLRRLDRINEVVGGRL